VTKEPKYQAFYYQFVNLDIDGGGIESFKLNPTGKWRIVSTTSKDTIEVEHYSFMLFGIPFFTKWISEMDIFFREIPEIVTIYCSKSK